MKRRKLCTGLLVIAFSTHQAFGVVGSQLHQDDAPPLPDGEPAVLMEDQLEPNEPADLEGLAAAILQLQTDIENDDQPCDDLLSRLDEL